MSNVVFITDRTISDVAQKTAKGCLNASDLNRIEKNSETIGQMAEISLVSKYDWEVGDLPRVSDFSRIISNVGILRNHAHRKDTPAIPTRPINHYEKYNAIEQIQRDCYEILSISMRNRAYTGEFYAGEGGLI